MFAQSTLSQRGRVTPQTQAPALRMFSTSDLASRWRLSERTLERWRQQGDGPKFVKLGSRVSYPAEAVAEFERSFSRRSTWQRAK